VLEVVLVVVLVVAAVVVVVLVVVLVPAHGVQATSQSACPSKAGWTQGQVAPQSSSSLTQDGPAKSQSHLHEPLHGLVVVVVDVLDV
jgi:hypothetical protein